MGTSNIALCSKWLTIFAYQQMELSNYNNHICGTFLVPKPKPITSASYVYLPLNTTTWWLIIGTLLITSSLYFLMYQQHYRRKTSSEGGRWESLGRTLLDVINIATSHGIPKIIQRVPIQLLVMCCMYLSLFVSTMYNTKLTSILTRPMYTKAVDNLQDFIDEGGESFSNS